MICRNKQTKYTTRFMEETILQIMINYKCFMLKCRDEPILRPGTTRHEHRVTDL